MWSKHERIPPIILCVETIGVSNTSNNHFFLMLKCLFEFGGLGLGELVGKLVNMGCDGSNVFQGHHIGVTLHSKEKVVQIFNGIHCFIHKINLAVITLSKLVFVHLLKNVLQRSYAFFVHNPKKIAMF